MLVDPVVESFRINPALSSTSEAHTLVHVMPKPGVTDPEAESALELLRKLGYEVSGVRTIRSYRVGPRELVPRLIQRVLANDAVEQAIVGATFRPSWPGPALRFSARHGFPPRWTMPHSST